MAKGDNKDKPEVASLMDGVRKIKAIPQPVSGNYISAKANEALPLVPAGKVYVVGVKPDGTEKSEGFIISEKMYNQVYANNAKWKLKKKPEAE